MATNDKDILSAIEIETATPVKKCVIWLHGLGADGNDFVPIVSELDLPKTLGIRFIFPHAPIMPITINNGYEMRAWYDILSLSINAHAMPDNSATSVTGIHHGRRRWCRVEMDRSGRPKNSFARRGASFERNR